MPETRSPPSRHKALAEQLFGEIAAGRYPVGSRFPSELELQARFETGRHTVREALKVLTEQGLLGRRRKTGTVVLAERPVAHYVHSLRDLRSLFDFAQDTRLSVDHLGFVSRLQGGLAGLPERDDDRWFRVAGLRSTREDGRPLCWSEVLVPARFAPPRDTLGHPGAIYETVMRLYRLRLDHVEQEISASALPRPLARLLEAEDQAAALVVRRRYVATAGAVFEISTNLYPADRYSVSSILRQRA